MGRKKKKASKPWCWYPLLNILKQYTRRDLRKWVRRDQRITNIILRLGNHNMDPIHFLNDYSGIVTGSLTTKRFSSNIRKRSILNVTFVTKSCTQDLDCPYTACRYVLTSRCLYTFGKSATRPRS